MAMFRSSIGLYLRYALVATTAVAVIPLLVVVAIALTGRTETSILTAGLIGAALSLVAVGLGSVWWKRRPESVDLSFGELMIWNFIRRRNAEKELERGAQVLGLDRKGLPLKRVPMTKQDRLKILQELASALETKDPYTHGHSRRVERLVAQTAVVLNLSEADTRELRTAAALHDVGKIRIPSSILRKPVRLTIDEQLIVQEHAAIGAWMVAGVSNGNIVTSVRHHHERWDGNGYPDGLAGGEIPLFARIIAVADAYDAMTSTRPYRASLDRRQARQELRNESGRQFDPEMVDAFLETAPKRVQIPALVGLGLIGRWLRRSTAWATKTGTAGVAPGVASVGAASVLIASVFAPPSALTLPKRPAETMLSRMASIPSGQLEFAASDGLEGDSDERWSRDGRRSERARTRAPMAKGMNAGKGPRVLAGVLTREKDHDPDGAPPSNGGEAPPANDPPDRGGNDGPGPGGNKPPKDNGDKPPKDNGDKPPKDNGNKPPKDDGNKPPKDDGDKPPKDDGDKPPKDDGDKPPKDDGNKPPKDDGNKPPKDDGDGDHHDDGDHDDGDHHDDKDGNGNGYGHDKHHDNGHDHGNGNGHDKYDD